ncbi:MAG TPA: sulfurtransferase [Telluria sp.]|nr:sulfurtransferase [Telluria sp.]
MYTTLISAADLASHIDDPNWVVIDCRHDLVNLNAGRDGYNIGHIKGAVFADIETELSGDKRGVDGAFRGRHPLPSRAAFIDTLRRFGVNADSQVVAYDAHGGMFAARLWWMLRWVGHEAVAVLDGGMAAWMAQGGAMETTEPQRQIGNIEAQPSLVGTVNVSDVLANLESREKLVVDARAADRFRGENETIDPVGGHIPGARNRFFKDNLASDGRFKRPEELRAEFSPIVDDPTKTIMQCGSGVTACHNLLALEVAGLPGALLYPGSWSEWCADGGRPIATGPA